VVVIRDSRRLIAGTAMVDFYGHATGNAFKLSTATRFGASSLTSVSERDDDDATVRGTGHIGERDADAPPWL
jgi:hypothetical protein